MPEGWAGFIVGASLVSIIWAVSSPSIGTTKPPTPPTHIGTVKTLTTSGPLTLGEICGPVSTASDGWQTWVDCKGKRYATKAPLIIEGK